MTKERETFNEKTWKMVIDHLVNPQTQQLNEQYVEKELLAGKVVARRVYIKGVLQE